MSYPGQFHRLVLIGTLYSDIWNMSLSIVPSALGELGMPAVDDATLSGVASDVETWFPKQYSSGGLGFITAVKLTSIKLNRIGSDGKYVDNAQEHIYPAPISGTTTGNIAPQLSGVITLGTRLDRGRGSKGRVYPPPCSPLNTLAGDGRLAQATALGMANEFKPLVVSLNARYTLIGRVGVASNAGTGKFEHVTRLSAGRVVDTMRSRRSTLLEDRQETPVP